MNRKSHLALPLGSTVKKLIGAALGAAAIAAPVQAGTITFESADPYMIYGSGDSYSEAGYRLFFEAYDPRDVGTAVGSIVDSSDPGTCLSTSCPNNGSLFYGSFNDSVVILRSETAGAKFRVNSIDASFIGAGAMLGEFPILSGYLTMLGVFADNSYARVNIPLYGPESSGFAFDRWNLNSTFAGMDFVQVEMFGYVCNTATCSAFSSNEAQFAIDNIVLTEVPEPATAAIFGLGLMGLIAGARRRKA